VEVETSQCGTYRFWKRTLNLENREDVDLAFLKAFGKCLDRSIRLGFTVRDWLMACFLKVRNKAGQLVPFIPNAAQQQIAARWGQRNIVLKARQMGMTTYVAARFYIDTITRPGTLTVQVAHDQRSAEDMFRIVHRFQENLPEVLRNGVLKTSRANSRQLVWPRLDSEYRVETAADPNAGRGATIRNLHCSEVAMWTRDGGGALASLRAAVPPDGQIVLESTPKGTGGVFYEEWHRSGETGYVQHFLPWWLEKSYRVPGVGAGELSDDERALMEKHGLDEEQIVYRRDRRANFRRETAQEYAESAEECFLASGDCFFIRDVVDQQVKTRCGADALAREKQLMEFFPPKPGKRYIIGVDSAGGGVDGDYSCAEVIDRETGLQCAELHAHLTPEELAKKVADLGKKYNHALLMVESNAYGGTVLSHLERVVGYVNVHHENGKPGIVTNVQTRPAMLDNLEVLVGQSQGSFVSPRFWRECRTFVRQHDGSPRAASGSHDDTVMAMALAQWARNINAHDRQRM